MSPRFHTLQKEISGRYQRTKDMLDKVFSRSTSSEAKDLSLFIERDKSQPDSFTLRASETEEKPRMARLSPSKVMVDEPVSAVISREIASAGIDCSMRLFLMFLSRFSAKETWSGRSIR